MEANSLPNGDKSQKRPEKRRQSLGGFFKGLVGARFTSSSWALGPGVWVLTAKGTDWPGAGRTFATQRESKRLLCARRVPGAEGEVGAGVAAVQPQAGVYGWGRWGRASHRGGAGGRGGTWREPGREDVAWPWG